MTIAPVKTCPSGSTSADGYIPCSRSTKPDDKPSSGFQPTTESTAAIRGQGHGRRGCGYGVGLGGWRVLLCCSKHTCCRVSPRKCCAHRSVHTSLPLVVGLNKILFTHRNHKLNKQVQETQKQYAYLSVVVVVVVVVVVAVVVVVVEGFYIALFSTLEQTHYARILFYTSDIL